MRWEALRAAGYRGPTREGGATIIHSTELAAGELHEYVGGRYSADAEPEALAALRSFMLLLRTPSALLATRDFRRIRADRSAHWAVGEALVEVIEWNVQVPAELQSICRGGQ